MNAKTYRMIYRKTTMFMFHFQETITKAVYGNTPDFKAEAVERLRDERHIAYLTLGLVGEAGELANQIKKYLRGDFSVDTAFREWAIKEVGDILWYVMGICVWLNIDMDEVMRINAEKLLDRKARDVLQGDGDNR